MASITALQLVNRVRLNRREPTTTVIATPEDEVTLNAINQAVEDILSTRRWEFDLRKDGQLALRARLDDCTIVTTAGSSSTTIARSDGLVDADVFGDYAVRVLPDGISDYANTAFRIERASSPSVNSTTAVLEVTFPTTNASSAAELHYSEYMLPDTIREVVRVTYQEAPLQLDGVDPVVTYAEMFPAPNYRVGPPEIVSVGGSDISTYDSSGSAPEPRLRMAIFPVPDDEYIINYSYYLRHPALVILTDTLDGVPPAVVDDIVFAATSTVRMVWDNDWAASHLGDLAQLQAARKALAYGGNKGRRHTISSFETGGNRVHVYRGFPGRLIG